MGTYKRGEKYWGEAQELLCQQWLTADTKQQYQIYNALLPKLNRMVELIGNRYFSIATSQRLSELKKDAIQEVFLKLKLYHQNKVKNKNGAYSFCGMIIKHYLHEVIVINGQRQKNTILEYTDDYEALDIKSGIEYYQKPEIDFKAISTYFKQKRVDIEGRKERLIKRWESKRIKTNYDKSTFTRVKNKYDKWLLICDLSLIFIEKHKSADVNHMAEYCFLNSDLKRSTVITAFLKMFKVNATIPDDDVNTADIKKGLNMYNDDYVPIQNKWRRRQYIKRKKTEGKDLIQYRYF